MEKLIRVLGGRKFILAIISVGVATAIELTTEHGLTTTMAGLLATLVGLFQLTNVAATATYEGNQAKKAQAKSTPHGEELASMSTKLDSLLGAIESSQNDPRGQEVLQLISETHLTTNQMATLMDTQNKLLQGILTRQTGLGPK